jgi:hypothetical protein
MRRQRLNRLSHAERAELNRQLKDAVDVGLIRPNYSEFGSPILFERKADGSLIWKLMEIVYNMCRQTGPTTISRATLLRHT